MNALSLSGLMVSLAPVAIAAWINPARDPELLAACLGTLAVAWVFTFLALVRFPAAVSARPRALLVHIAWGLVAVITVLDQIQVPYSVRVALMLLPVPVHVIRLLRRPHALAMVLAVQVAVLFSVSWILED